MKEAMSQHGFQIRDAKIPIVLALRQSEDLRPHEETVPEDLDAIVLALQSDPVLRHPIIADSISGAVLDGTHRLAALKRLDCQTIPAALIDYQNPLIQIDRWYRTITGGNVRALEERVHNLHPVKMSDSEADRSLLARSSYATLRDARGCWAFKSQSARPLDLCRDAFKLELIAKGQDAKITYADKSGPNDQSSSALLMSTIRLAKEEVVDGCMKHQLFPPKSTRHLIPSRPLGVTVPLQWLMETNIEEAEKKFEAHLSSMAIRRLPEGSIVGSRRYMEEVFLFE
jgi:L-serine kinase (ADP)